MKFQFLFWMQRSTLMQNAGPNEWVRSVCTGTTQKTEEDQWWRLHLNPFRWSYSCSDPVQHWGSFGTMVTWIVISVFLLHFSLAWRDISILMRRHHLPQFSMHHLWPGEQKEVIWKRIIILFNSELNFAEKHHNLTDPVKRIYSSDSNSHTWSTIHWITTKQTFILHIQRALKDRLSCCFWFAQIWWW